MKTASKDLADLIKSLSKAERVYFAKFASLYSRNRASDYMKLFKEINAQTGKGTYDENLIKNNLRREKFAGRLNVTKHYLYNLVLRSLSSFYTSSTDMMKLSEYIRQVHILYVRKQPRQCFSVIKRAKRLAYEAQYYEELLILLNYESRVAVELFHVKSDIDPAGAIYEEHKRVLKILSNKYLYRSLYMRVWLCYLRSYERNEDHTQIIHKILKTRWLQNEKYAISDVAKLNYYFAKAMCHVILKQSERELNTLLSSIRFFETHPLLLKNNFTTYLGILSNASKSAFLCGKQEISFEILEKIKAAPARAKVRSTQVLLIQFESFVYYYSILLGVSISTGNIDEPLRYISEITSGIEKFRKLISNYEKGAFFKYISIVYFINGDFNVSLDWVNKILNEKIYAEGETFQSSILLFDLILHYELGNFKLLEYKERTTREYLRKHTVKDRYAGEMLRFIRNIVSGNRTITENLVVTKLRLEKINTKSSRPDEEIRAEFDFRLWVESKTKGISYQKALQIRETEKYRNDSIVKARPAF
jgi:hypothetical protein